MSFSVEPSVNIDYEDDYDTTFYTLLYHGERSSEFECDLIYDVVKNRQQKINSIINEN